MRLLDPRSLRTRLDAAREAQVLEPAIVGDAGAIGAQLLAHQELLGDRGLHDVPRLLGLGRALEELALGIHAEVAEDVEPGGEAQVLAPRVEAAATAVRRLDRGAQPA